MKNTLKYLVLTLVLMTSIFSKAQTNFETTSWEAIKQKAKKQDKLIFVDLYFTGCAPCDKMNTQVFPNKTVSNILNENFISFKSDIFKAEIAKKLSMKYGANGFPTFIFLNAEGKVVDLDGGYHNVKEFTELLYTIQDKASKGLYKKYSTSLDGDYPTFYRDAFMKNKRKISFETVDAYLKSKKDLDDEIPFIIMSSLRVGGPYEEYIFENAQQLANDYGHMQVKNNIRIIVVKKAENLGKENNLTAFNTLLKSVKPFFTKTEWVRYESLFQEKFNTNKL
ncbi:thioredoxin family protein [Bacteroidota bacterium]